MKQYSDLVRHVLETGTRKENRTGVDTISTFGYYFEHDLREGFPLLTTKSVSWKNIVVEMLWFLSGQTDISILKRHGCKFWDAWADPETGKVPSAYGNFWRHFPVHGAPVKFSSGGVEADIPIGAGFNDQIAWVLAELKRNPMSRRMVVSAWAPENAQTSKLPPCHCLFMFNVQNEPLYDPKPVGVVMYDRTGELTGAPLQKKIGDKQRLCLHLTQRSCDTALGVPYNIASYALLLSLFSHFTGIEPGIFGHTLVDAHIYTAKPDGSKAEFDHVPGLKEQIAREPRPLPRLRISDQIKSLADIEQLMSPEVTTDEVMKHFVLEGYDPHPAINFKVAV
jgi:thymidylate synthase